MVSYVENTLVSNILSSINFSILPYFNKILMNIHKFRCEHKLYWI
jgi:hypothetical protein